MRFANIVPTAFLNTLGSQTNYHLALTHLVHTQGPEYIDFMLRRSKAGDFIIMDNSLIELGDAMDIADVAEAAGCCGAHEIVLKDVFLKKEETIQAIDASIVRLKQGYKGYRSIPFRLMAVPQGKDFQEWLSCLTFILGHFPEVTTIGIPKVTNTFFGGSIGRVEVIDYLNDQDFPKRYPHIQWHMLGVWNNPIELKYVSGYKWIRGCDTSIAWACAQKGIMFDLNEGLLIDRPKEVKIDFNDKIDRFPVCTSSNLIAMLTWARYHE